MKFKIYSIASATNKKHIRYIGCSAGPVWKRIRRHLHCSLQGVPKTPVYRFIRNNPIIIITILHETTNLNEAIQLEKQEIDRHTILGHELTNIRSGGELHFFNKKHSQETREKMTLKATGRKLSTEHRNKLKLHWTSSEKKEKARQDCLRGHRIHGHSIRENKECT